MIQIVDYRPEHALAMHVQKAQPVLITKEYAEALTEGPAITGMLGDTVLFCVGKIKLWGRRWSVWCLLSEEARVHMTAITRIAHRLLSMQIGTGRHEVIISSGFKEAHRWARLVGFQYHHHEEQFLPDGGDADIYLRFC